MEFVYRLSFSGGGSAIYEATPSSFRNTAPLSPDQSVSQVESSQEELEGHISRCPRLPGGPGEARLPGGPGGASLLGGPGGASLPGGPVDSRLPGGPAEARLQAVRQAVLSGAGRGGVFSFK